MNPEELYKAARQHADKATAIQNELDSPDCDLNAEQKAKREEKIEEHLDKAEALKKQADAARESKIKADKRREKLASIIDEPERVTGSEQPGASVKVEKPNFTKDPMKGFNSPREYFGAVVKASVNPGKHKDARLNYLAAVGSDEHSGASDPYGGFLVPEGMSPQLLTLGIESNPLIGRVQNIPMGSPSIKINARVDKNHSTSVSGGLTVSRRGETGAFSSSRMEFEQIELTAATLAGLSYSTEELLRDSPQSVGALLEAGFRDQFASQNVLDLLYGTGVGEPLGVLNSGATVTVAKEGGQTADTIVTNNILKMRQRVYNYSNAIWMANHDTYIELTKLNIESTTPVGATFLFAPGNGTDRPDTLLGRPIIFSEYAATLGDKGDIMCVNMAEYLYGVYQPLESAESIHVRFLNHEQAFKFTLRDAGAPWWKTAMTPAKGANTMSPFVTLAARA